MKVTNLSLTDTQVVFDDHRYVFSNGGDEPWVVEMNELYKERGAIWAMVAVYRCAQSVPIDPPVVGPSRVNILRESRGGGLIDIIERMADAYPEFGWEDIFQQAKLMTLRALDSQIDPTSLLTRIGDNTGPPLLSRPYLAGNGLTLLYGDGGTGKSALAMALSLELVSGVRIISEWVPKDRTPVLYIDYEDAHDTHSERVLAMASAHSVPTPNIEGIHRVHLVDILAHHVKELARYTDEHSIGFVVLDSLGMACGGDITASEPVIRMGQALRALGVPALGIHHNNKSGLPYGSVYIRNIARLMWQANNRATKEGDPWDYIYLENDKANNVRRQPVQYLKVRFDNDDGHLEGIRYEPTDVHGFPAADKPPTDGPSTAGVILMFLELNAGTRYTVTEIAEEMETSENSARNQLNALAKDGRIKKDSTTTPRRYWVDDLPIPF